MFRRLLPALLVVTLALAACGASEETTATSSKTACATSKLVDAVEVGGDFGEKPTLEFDLPLDATTTSCKVVVKGTGAEVETGSLVTFHYLFVNGRDGTELVSSFGAEPGEILFDEQLLEAFAGLHTALGGLPAGSRVLVALAPEDGPFQGEADPTTGVAAGDSIVVVVDVEKVEAAPADDPAPIPALERATGVAIEPVEGLPTVELDENGAPTITVPQTDPPAELIAQVLIEGAGDTVEAGQTITVHYTGVLWDTGEKFDSSWDSGSPASFSIGTAAVIAGWDKGLVGQAVGSQVLLVIPGPDAYPDGRPGIPAGATLVFVVDILAAHA